MNDERWTINHFNLQSGISKIKSEKPITIGIIDPMVIEFLKIDFPQKNNASVFNKRIKELCQLAGIDQIIKGNKMSSITKRVELGMYPKYELIASHAREGLLQQIILGR
ncbi:MAG: hypothetical protein ACI8ZX_000112 [Planctomycetota bacterium]|jgi:hypothetical protein